MTVQFHGRTKRGTEAGMELWGIDVVDGLNNRDCCVFLAAEHVRLTDEGYDKRRGL